jgi:ubiquinone/menaquinone biosynthesis C-methylase UbiE
VELIQHNIEIFKQNTEPGEKITIAQGNAMDLKEFADNIYDITLDLGPLYHLYNNEDKQKALNEAIRVTKCGGVIFVAYIITDACILNSGFRQNRFSVAEFIEKGHINPQTFAASSESALIFELVRKEDIDALMNGFSVTRLHYVATDGYIEHMHEEIDNMDKETFELYLKYHFATCEREDMVGLTHHSLDIFRKD